MRTTIIHWSVEQKQQQQQHLLISAPSLGVYYYQQLTLSVCPDVPLSVVTPLQIASSFLFLDGIEPFFDRQFST